MDIDPNVQVAIVSVFATTITTLGVIAVAFINNRKERGKAASAGVDAALDERDILERMLSLISENDRKEDTITSLRKRIKVLNDKTNALEEEVRMLHVEIEKVKGAVSE